MDAYRQRPTPSGLHAKYLAELSEARRGDYVITASAGNPNNIFVRRRGDNAPLWRGHRDLMPAAYRGAADPDNLLTRPASD